VTVRRAQGPGRGSLAASLLLHLLALAVIWATGFARPEPLEFVAYQIEIVSLPATETGEPEPQKEELVVETPEPPPAEEEPPPVVEEEPKREEPKPRPTPTPPPPEPEQAEKEETPKAPEAEPEAPAGGEGINVRMEGLRRDYPAYYENIIRQIHRCMRFNGPGGLRTTVFFYILPDGSVEDFRFVERSGNVSFDYAVMGAVECAGRGRLGPLPEDLRMDRFPILFEVQSARRSGTGGESTPGAG